MLKSELIALLSDPDIPNCVILISGDEEGNAFHVLNDVDYYSEADDPDDMPFAFEEAGLSRAIILWP